MKTATVIGGGTGSFIVLSGLKKYDINLGVIVSMMDSGGSTGRLRDQLGVLPPGDLRQCLVALSDKSYLLGLYLFYNKKTKESKECKTYFNKFLSEKIYISKIKNEFSDTNDFTPRFNYLVHHIFTSVTDNGNLKYLPKKEILNVAKEYSKEETSND